MNPEMPIEVAQALLEYKKVMTDLQWTTLKDAYRRALASYSPEHALRIAGQAAMRRPSNRPPA